MVLLLAVVLKDFWEQTFVRPNNTDLVGKFFPPNQEPNPGTDYWKTDRTVERNKSLGMALILFKRHRSYWF